MKNSIQLAALGLVLSVSIVACDPPKSNTATTHIDTVIKETSTKVIDTIKKDSAGNVTGIKKDSVTVTKTKKVKTEKE